MKNRPAALAAALILFAVWTGATWLLEGRIETFLRPDAVVDRLVYTGVANIAIGILGAAGVLALAFRRWGAPRRPTGFGHRAPSPFWLPVAVVLGLGLYFAQGAPSTDPVVILNAYAQVFVVSVAEVLVCWCVLGGLLAGAIPRPRFRARIAAAAVASLAFGLYHFAHSPPFNTPGLVAFLAAVGLVTSLFFLFSRDTYSTIVFHNFLGVFGVVQALAAAGRLEAFGTPQVPLFATALVALAVLAAADALIVRRQ